MTENVVEVRDLKINFTTYEGIMKVLDGVNLRIRKGEVLGLVGETGCGKTMTGRAIMRILPSNAIVVNGEINFEGKTELLKLKEDEMRNIRGKQISMIFQEPRRALHPTLNVGNQISEVYELHMKEEILKTALKEMDEYQGPFSNTIRGIYAGELEGKKPVLKKIFDRIPFLRGSLNEPKKGVLIDKSRKMLGMVQIPDPERVSEQYPHELSGGMMQRVLISIALACNPKLLIADEPTTSVDVTTQAKLLDLIMDLKKSYGGSILLITHNLAVVAETCDRVCVMYAGTIVEEAETGTLFNEPIHPYTKGLLAAIPIIGRKKELKSIPGFVPNFLNPPSGCRFHPRCNLAEEICSEKKPSLVEVEKGHFVACHKLLGGLDGDV
jgi:peptide/nickel transport system ATP-binding protein